MDSKWRVVSSETLIKDRWIDVRADHCVTDSGIEIAPYYVLNFPDWVHVLAITADEQIVLVRQYRHAASAFFIEPPGGAMDKADADAEATARRELMEETGYVADSWECVTAQFVDPARQTNRLHVYLARGASLEGDQALDPGEDGLSVCLMPVSELVPKLLAGGLGGATHNYVLLLGLAAAGYLTPQRG